MISRVSVTARSVDDWALASAAVHDVLHRLMGPKALELQENPQGLIARLEYHDASRVFDYLLSYLSTKRFPVKVTLELGLKVSKSYENARE
jgi:hypothetical protein